MILHQKRQAYLPIYLAVVSVNTRPRPDSARTCYFLFFVVSTTTTAAAQQETIKTMMGATTCNVLLGEVEATCVCVTGVNNNNSSRARDNKQRCQRWERQPAMCSLVKSRLRGRQRQDNSSSPSALIKIIFFI